MKLPLARAMARTHLSTLALAGALALTGCTESTEPSDADSEATEAAASALTAPADVRRDTGAPKKGEPRDPIGDVKDHLQFAISLPESFPAAREEIAFYKVVRGAPPAGIDAMAQMFGTKGVAESSNEFGGLVHVRDGQRHMYVFDSGGAVFHDVERIGSTNEIEPLDDESLWQDAARRIAELHLQGPGLPELVRGRIMTARAAHGIRTSTPKVDWPVAQSVTFEQRLGGLPVFGAGSDVQIVYGEGGRVVSFTSQVRPFKQEGTIAIASAEEAVANYLDRANKAGRWNLAKAFVKDVRKLTIDHAQLGYYMPPLSSPCDAAEPVWAIAGTAEGLDGRGYPTRVPVLWLEPAAAGRTLADINVSSEPEK